jgi:hypothetical protein
MSFHDEYWVEKQFKIMHKDGWGVLLSDEEDDELEGWVTLIDIVDNERSSSRVLLSPEMVPAVIDCLHEFMKRRRDEEKEQ